MSMFYTADNLATPHGFFGRKGGNSTGIYASLNVGFGSNDEASLVTLNREQAIAYLHSDNVPLATVQQVHSNKVHLLNHENKYNSSTVEADAIITSLSNYAIGILTADCAPILAMDSKQRIIGACHAGWRGAAAGILPLMLEKMCTHLDAKLSNIAVALGPMIGIKSYEIGTEVQTELLTAYPQSNDCFTTRSNKLYFDLRRYLTKQISPLGLQSIRQIEYDTYTHPELLYSYRRSTHLNEDDFGRQLSVIMQMEG